LNRCPEATVAMGAAGGVGERDPSVQEDQGGGYSEGTR
jgi:hypothetical protein